METAACNAAKNTIVKNHSLEHVDGGNVGPPHGARALVKKHTRFHCRNF